MLFDVEPSGINDGCLRLARNGGECLVGPTGSWNGLLRLDYLIAGGADDGACYLVVRTRDVGFDDGRFQRRGRAGVVLATAAMVAALVSRGLVTDPEGQRLLPGGPVGAGNGGDDSLMLRAVLAGCTFSPFYRAGTPPRVAGYALRTLGDRAIHALDARDGVPVLTPDARDALLRMLMAG